MFFMMRKIRARRKILVVANTTHCACDCETGLSSICVADDAMVCVGSAIGNVLIVVAGGFSLYLRGEFQFDPTIGRSPVAHIEIHVLIVRDGTDADAFD